MLFPYVARFLIIFSVVRRVTGCVERLFWFHFFVRMQSYFCPYFVQVTVNVVCFYPNTRGELVHCKSCK